jgi:DNA-binding NarL/FixJ family response regulator
MRKNILIVDDSEVMRVILKNLLEQNKEWTVNAEAMNGPDAIQKAREIRPDLVVLDFAMPSMDGLELAHELKRINPRMPIVMLTAFKDDALDKRAYEAGVTWVLSKTDGVNKVFDFARILLRPDASPAPYHQREEKNTPHSA